MSTNKISVKNVQRKWHLIDAKNQILGRLSTQIAKILMGKNKATYLPYLDSGDHVVVINAKKIKVSGNKEYQKKYTRHSGYPGGLRVEVLSKVREIKPEHILVHAIQGMLPKTKLGHQMIKKLHVFSGGEHPYQRELRGFDGK